MRLGQNIPTSILGMKRATFWRKKGKTSLQIQFKKTSSYVKKFRHFFFLPHITCSKQHWVLCSYAKFGLDILQGCMSKDHLTISIHPIQTLAPSLSTALGLCVWFEVEVHVVSDSYRYQAVTIPVDFSFCNQIARLNLDMLASLYDCNKRSQGLTRYSRFSMPLSHGQPSSMLCCWLPAYLIASRSPCGRSIFLHWP